MSQRTISIAMVCGTILLAAVASPAGAQTGRETCSEFVELAEKAVPERVGDRDLVSALLSPEVGSQLSQTFEPEKAQQILRDVLRPTDPCADCRKPDREHEDGRPADRGETLLRGTDGTLLRAKLANGKVAYLNRRRGHDPVAGQEVQLSRDEALALSFEAAQAFGVPMEELDRKFVEVRELIAAGRDSEGQGEPTRLRAEVHVRIPRRIGPFPVFDSYLQVAVGAQQLIARLHLKWPDFHLVPGLAPETALDREQVIERILDELAESALCGSLAEVIAEIAYVQADQLAISSTEADDGDRWESTADRAFAPALVVYAVPVTPKEDSGEIGFAGLQFVVPLLEASSDGMKGEKDRRDDA